MTYLSRQVRLALLALLPLERGATWTNMEWRIAARVLVDQKRSHAGASTGIKSLSHVLNSRKKLDRLQKEIDSATRILKTKRMILARHGIRYEGFLKAKSGKFLALARSSVLELQNFGYESFFGYGTLLGAVREGEFLQHDDDLDILFRAHSSTYADVSREVDELVAKFVSRGYRVESLLPKFLNVHVSDPKSGAMIDLFPYWLNNGKAYLHMEKMKVRGISESILIPHRLISIHDQLAPAPNAPRSFLQERYGEGWETADPYYEWPWRLRD